MHVPIDHASCCSEQRLFSEPLRDLPFSTRFFACVEKPMWISSWPPGTPQVGL